LIRPGTAAFGKYFETKESAASPLSFTAWALAAEEIMRRGVTDKINLFTESWLRKTGQGDKWIFCLTAARIAAIQERK